MNIVCSCKMGEGTFEAKFVPLSKVESIKNIYVLRKQKGKEIKKIEYILMPRLKIFSIFITPILLTYYTYKYKANFILAYHVVPHAFFAFIASMVTRKPFIVGQTGLNIQRLSEKVLIGRIVIFVLKKAYRLNVPGNYSKNHWQRKGIDPNKINLLHSTIDTDHFVNENQPKEYDFIFLGRLAWEKNIALIIQAFNILSKENLKPNMVIVGDGPERSMLERRVCELNLSKDISFVGFQSDVKFWLNKSRIFVMASTTEAMPTALMQAMACELICISSRIGNIPDLLVDRVNGYLFKSEDLNGLVEIMRDSFINYSSKAQIGIQARRDVVCNHSYNNAIEKWKLLIEEIYNKPNAT